MPENLALLIMLALPLLGSPGPVNLSLAAMGSAFGMPASLRYLAGTVLGSAVVLLAVPAGQVILTPGLPAPVLPLLGALAGGYLFYLAWRIAATPPDRAAAPRAPFSGGFLLAFGNPKAYVAVAAICSAAMAEAGETPAEFVLKLAVVALVSLSVKTFWLVAGAALGELTTTPQQARLANVAFAVLLLLSLAIAIAL